jgi:hypothetical protein
MGQARHKKKHFFAVHPSCCFCGGTTGATTIDHVPPRVCFPGRIVPDGFEFPACVKCQAATRLDEQIFGLYARALDWNDENFEKNEVDKLIRGVFNNASYALPNPFLGANAKRNVLKAWGLQKPREYFVRDLPIISIDQRVNASLLSVANKLACAIYYKEKLRCVPQNSYIWSYWSAPGIPNDVSGIQNFIDMTPLLRNGVRTNMKFDGRFSYRINKADTPDILACVSQFGAGLIAISVIVDETSMKEVSDPDSWRRIGDIFSATIEIARPQ